MDAVQQRPEAYAQCTGKARRLGRRGGQCLRNAENAQERPVRLLQGYRSAPAPRTVRSRYRLTSVHVTPSQREDPLYQRLRRQITGLAERFQLAVKKANAAQIAHQAIRQSHV